MLWYYAKGKPKEELDARQDITWMGDELVERIQRGRARAAAVKAETELP